jgi:small subunit ribosomal protein S3
MGQKVNPINFRTGGIFNWKSLWFASKADYANKVLEDYRLREYLEKSLANAGLVESEIKRSINKLLVVISVARPGVVIGKVGANLEKIKQGIERVVNVSKYKKDKARIELKVEE